MYILMDLKTRCFYMKPLQIMFFAYTNKDLCKKYENATVAPTSFDTDEDFFTAMYNAGFVYGYIDDKEVKIPREKVKYYDVNKNEIAFAQYLLTGDEHYLEYLIQKDRLCTLSKITEEGVSLPTNPLQDGNSAIFTYTDPSRIPQSLLERYPDYQITRMTFNLPCVVNNKFIID